MSKNYSKIKKLRRFSKKEEKSIFEQTREVCISPRKHAENLRNRL